MLSAGTSDPSSTRLLADRLAAKVAGLREDATTNVVEIAPLAADVAAALTGGPASAALEASFATLRDADVVIAATPVYKAGISGLFKAYVDLLDDDLLVGTTVIAAATAGSARHALVAEDHLRPLFAFLRAVVVPTSVFAAPEDWRDPALGRRIERAAAEADVLARTQEEIRGRDWDAYQHRFDSRAAAPPGGDEIDFDTPLMRLANGGPAPSSG